MHHRSDDRPICIFSLVGSTQARDVCLPKSRGVARALLLWWPARASLIFGVALDCQGGGGGSPHVATPLHTRNQMQESPHMH